MRDPKKFCRLSAGTLGFMAIAFGAFGAHGLKSDLAVLGAAESARRLDWLATGARIQLAHAVALLALACPGAFGSFPRLRWIPLCFSAGALIFGASLYAMALGAPLWLGAVTPVGGLLLLAGWALVALSAFEP
jgi:uncharacterized membrane protein YgdD (TMEM256/DUF423 family)